MEGIMRKAAIAGVLFLVIGVMFTLGRTATDPQDYSGEWYSADCQCIYLFQEGIIYSRKHTVPLTEGNAISGAYIFAGDTVALFAVGVDGLETVKELYLIQNEEGSILCENRNEDSKIFFIRANPSK